MDQGSVTVRPTRSPFKSYSEFARHLSAEGRLALPRPPRCLRCGADCGFTKGGHYFRDFVFLDAVAEHVGVQRYECERTEDATFSALAAFQETGAHYTVEVRGEAIEEVFVRGSSQCAAWRTLRRRDGCRTLSRSTVTRWCHAFRRRAGHLGGVLAAHLAHARVTSDPAALIVSARAAFRLHRGWPRFRFWEWFRTVAWAANRGGLLSPARRDRRLHVSVCRFEPANRLRSPP